MKKEKKEIKCTAIYTEGCGDRLTKALVDIYYARKRLGIMPEPKKDNKEKTA